MKSISRREDSIHEVGKDVDMADEEGPSQRGQYHRLGIRRPRRSQTHDLYMDTEDHASHAYEIFEPLAAYTPYIDKCRNISPTPPIQKTQLNDRIEMGTVRSWLRTCEQAHRSHCSGSYIQSTEPSTSSQWLIDVRKFCLVPVKSHQRYVALSCVWGTSRSTTTTTANVVDLQKENALKATSVILAKTVTDAIDFVGQLGKMKYLRRRFSSMLWRRYTHRHS